jgi:hypothetical protein
MARVGHARKKYGVNERGRLKIKCRTRKIECRPRVMICVRKRREALRAARVLAAFYSGSACSLGAWVFSPFIFYSLKIEERRCGL